MKNLILPGDVWQDLRRSAARMLIWAVSMFAGQVLVLEVFAFLLPPEQFWFVLTLLVFGCLLLLAVGIFFEGLSIIISGLDEPFIFVRYVRLVCALIIFILAATTVSTVLLPERQKMIDQERYQDSYYTASYEKRT